MTKHRRPLLLDLQGALNALEDFPGVVAEKRQQHGLSLLQLSQLSGISPAAIRTIEWRNRMATVGEARELIRAIVALENERRAPYPQQWETYESPSARLNRNLEAAELPGRVLTKQEREQ